MKRMVLLIAGLVLASATSGWAQDLTDVNEIVKRTNRVAYYQGNDGKATVKMTITDKGGGTRTREFTILRRNGADPATGKQDEKYMGDQQFYVYFHRPADVNKTAFLVHKHVDKDDDRWLYLPALDLVNRIASNEKRTSFVGSDFYYEDVSGRNINLDKHELINTTDTYYVLKNTPKDPNSVEFSYYVMYIHKKTFVPVQTQYFDKKGEKYRVYTVQKVDTIQGFPTIMKSEMADLRSGSKTLLEYTDVKYNIGLPRNLFTERYLRRPPMRYLD